MHKKLICHGLPFLNSFPLATVDQGEPRVSAFRRRSQQLPLTSGGLFGTRGWGNLHLLGGEHTYHMLLDFILGRLGSIYHVLTEGNR
jgi:hypothetical protein